MKAFLKGRITAMTEIERSESLVSITVQPKGTVADAKGPDAKKIEMDMAFFVKPLVAQELKFGQELFFEVSTEPHADSKDRLYCYHCGGRLDRKGPRDCPVCS